MHGTRKDTCSAFLFQEQHKSLDALFSFFFFFNGCPQITVDNHPTLLRENSVLCSREAHFYIGTSLMNCQGNATHL